MRTAAMHKPQIKLESGGCKSALIVGVRKVNLEFVITGWKQFQTPKYRLTNWDIWWAHKRSQVQASPRSTKTQQHPLWSPFPAKQRIDKIELFEIKPKKCQQILDNRWNHELKLGTAGNLSKRMEGLYLWDTVMHICDNPWCRYSHLALFRPSLRLVFKFLHPTRCKAPCVDLKSKTKMTTYTNYYCTSGDVFR